MDLHIDHLGEVDIKDLRGSYGTEPGRLHGDFYCEHDDVVRGAQLSSTHDLVFAKDSGYPEHDGSASAGAGFHEDAFNTLLADRHLHGPLWASARFSDQAGLPATLPCQAAVTSIAIEGASPADVATFVHTFLTTSVRAVVTKVCPRKFAMKAEVFHDVAGCPMSCKLKARVFQSQDAPREEPRLVVEFQRRAGDSLAFNSVFRLARGALLRRFSAAEPQHALAAGPPEDEDLGWAPAGATEVGPEELQPLLDMLVDHSSVTQAEAVGALVALASASAAGAHTVCRLLADFGGVLQTLLSSDQLQVSFPAARLVRMLARNVDRSEVTPILRCVDADPALTPAVRSELAEVLAQ